MRPSAPATVGMTEPFRRRKRPAISCTLCRKRKIRCNHETPCSNCVRSRNAACVYETEPQHAHLGDNARILPRPSNSYQPTAMPPTPSSTTSATSNELDTMRARLAELEGQLSRPSSMASPKPYTAAASPAATQPLHFHTSLAGQVDVLQDSRAFGQAHVISRSISHKNRVFGQSHWMNGFVVLHDVIEILEPMLRGGMSNMLPGIHRAKNLARVIKSQRSPLWPTLPTTDLPSKHICDELINCYQRTIETLYRILHVPTFRRQYDKLWTESTDRPTAFLVQLKLVLAIGAILYDEKCSLRAQAIQWIYEAQTWLSSPVFKSQLGIQYLQMSILLLLARELADVGGELVWISAGAVLRTAIYIGLHKDPNQLPQMSRFECEMRRRIWNTALEINLQFSLMSGGPCLLSMEDFTTEPPGNFDDEQLTGEPTVGPATVYTQSSVSIALRKTFTARLAVIKFLNDVASTGTYEETLRIDTQMRAVYKNLRHNLENFVDASKPQTFALETVDFIMNRYINALHLPFFNASLHEAVYAYSRKSVFDSSLKVWTLACPNRSLLNTQWPSTNATSASPYASNETDLARICRCGAGFFRASAFHSSLYLAVELRAQLQEEDTVPRPDLVNIIDDAANMYLRCIEAGETGIKGYLLFGILAAQVDGIKRRVSKEEMPLLLAKASEESIERAMSVLERLAGQDQDITDVVPDFEFDVSPDFMEDWDMVMSDVFDFDKIGMFDALLT